jgi:hypothetical protein
MAKNKPVPTLLKGTHTGLRDRALLGVLAYRFARIGATVNLKVEDYYPSEALVAELPSLEIPMVRLPENDP